MSDPVLYTNATLGFRQWYSSLEAEGNEHPFLEGLMKYDFHRPRYRWDLEGPTTPSAYASNFILASSPKNTARCPKRDAHAASAPTAAETVPTARPQFTWWGVSWRDGGTLSCTIGVSSVV